MYKGKAINQYEKLKEKNNGKYGNLIKYEIARLIQ